MNYDPSSFAAFGIVGIIIGIIVYLVIVAIGLLIFWAIIRSAVKRALRDHQEWLEARGRL
jgi:hypothetical protein